MEESKPLYFADLCAEGGIGRCYICGGFFLESELVTIVIDDAERERLCPQCAA